jgi:predicted pyridoxine 5'-phosphate oxidase superfamily flavin-nucleotide-binding protein
MGARYLREILTPEVLAAQERQYGRTYARPDADIAAAEAPLDADAIAFLAERDSIYLATVTSDGWPYIQHRGGPKGFIRALDDHTIAFADLKGNRQLVSTGNLATSDRIALFAMDYPARTRLKLRGHARVHAAADVPELVAKLLVKSPKLVERVIEIEITATDWNCPAHITPRYTLEEIRALTGGS